MKSDKNKKFYEECLKLLSYISPDCFEYNNKSVYLIIQDYRNITYDVKLIEKKE